MKTNLILFLAFLFAVQSWGQTNTILTSTNVIANPTNELTLNTNGEDAETVRLRVALNEAKIKEETKEEEEKRQIAYKQGQINSAYQVGYAAGQDYKGTGGNQMNPDFTPTFVMRNSYPKLEKFPQLKDSFISGFLAGYKSGVSYAEKYKDEIAATPPPSGTSHNAISQVLNAPHVSGTGNTKGDAYAIARGNLPSGATEGDVTYIKVGSGSGYYYNCFITYSTK